MKRICITVSEDKIDYVDKMSRALIGTNRSIIFDLLVDVVMGNFADDMVKQHYLNAFSRQDGRKKNGS